MSKAGSHAPSAPSSGATADALLEGVNRLLHQIGLGDHPFTSTQEIADNASSLIVAVFESLFATRIAGIVRRPKHAGDYIHNAQLAIDTLRALLPPACLLIPSDITGDAIAEGDIASIAFLVALFLDLDRVIRAGGSTLGPQLKSSSDQASGHRPLSSSSNGATGSSGSGSATIASAADIVSEQGRRSTARRGSYVTYDAPPTSETATVGDARAAFDQSVSLADASRALSEAAGDVSESLGSAPASQPTTYARDGGADLAGSLVASVSISGSAGASAALPRWPSVTIRPLAPKAVFVGEQQSKSSSAGESALRFSDATSVALSMTGASAGTGSASATTGGEAATLSYAGRTDERGLTVVPLSDANRSSAGDDPWLGHPAQAQSSASAAASPVGRSAAHSRYVSPTATAATAASSLSQGTTTSATSGTVASMIFQKGAASQEQSHYPAETDSKSVSLAIDTQRTGVSDGVFNGGESDKWQSPLAVSHAGIATQQAIGRSITGRETAISNRSADTAGGVRVSQQPSTASPPSSSRPSPAAAASTASTASSPTGRGSRLSQSSKQGLQLPLGASSADQQQPFVQSSFESHDSQRYSAANVYSASSSHGIEAAAAKEAHAQLQSQEYPQWTESTQEDDATGGQEQGRGDSRTTDNTIDRHASLSEAVAVVTSSALRHSPVGRLSSSSSRSYSHDESHGQALLLEVEATCGHSGSVSLAAEDEDEEASAEDAGSASANAAQPAAVPSAPVGKGEDLPFLQPSQPLAAAFKARRSPSASASKPSVSASPSTTSGAIASAAAAALQQAEYSSVRPPSRQSPRSRSLRQSPRSRPAAKQDAVPPPEHHVQAAATAASASSSSSSAAADIGLTSTSSAAAAAAATLQSRPSSSVGAPATASATSSQQEQRNSEDDYRYLTPSQPIAQAFQAWAATQRRRKKVTEETYATLADYFQQHSSNNSSSSSAANTSRRASAGAKSSTVNPSGVSQSSAAASSPGPLTRRRDQMVPPLSGVHFAGLGGAKQDDKQPSQLLPRQPVPGAAMMTDRSGYSSISRITPGDATARLSIVTDGSASLGGLGIGPGGGVREVTSAPAYPQDEASSAVNAAEVAPIASASAAEQQQQPQPHASANNEVSADEVDENRGTYCNDEEAALEESLRQKRALLVSLQEQEQDLQERLRTADASFRRLSRAEISRHEQEALRRAMARARSARHERRALAIKTQRAIEGEGCTKPALSTTI